MVMVHVVLALIPGLAIHCWFGGLGAVLVVSVATATSLLTELACTRSTQDLTDGSAVVTGILIGLCLPATTPWFVPIVASVIAIGLAKHAFGGLGNNVFNPAMVGYVVVLVSYPAVTTEFDSISGATSLEQIAHRGATTIAEIETHPAFGTFGAVQQEWVNVGFLFGGIYLLALRLIPMLVPACVLIGLGSIAFLLDDGGSSLSHGSPVFNWFAGGTMLTAFFIATDPVTSPTNRSGLAVYALLIGVLAMLIRKYASWPDGFAFAVLLANCLVPLLDRLGIRSSRP